MTCQPSCKTHKTSRLHWVDIRSGGYSISDFETGTAIAFVQLTSCEDTLV